MRIPYLLLKLLPRWDYICPRCKREVKQKSHKCPYCNENYGLPLRVPPKVLKDKKALEDYVHQHIFPKVSSLYRAYLTQFFTEIFSDGFESNNFNAWTGTETGGTGSTITVGSIDPHHGLYHAVAHTEIAGSYACAYKTITEQTTVFIRGYVKVKTNLPASGKYYDPMGFYAGGYNGTSIAYAAIYNDAGTIRWVLRLRNGATLETNISSSTVSLDTWYCVELKVIISDTGEGRLYINGIEVVSATGKDTNNYGNINCVVVGEKYSDGATIHDIYVDCVVAADAYIGEEGAGQPYVSRVQQVSGMQTFNPIHLLKFKPRKLI